MDIKKLLENLQAVFFMTVIFYYMLFLAFLSLFLSPQRP